MKKGNILMENVIFIILNLVFLSMLLLFIYLKSSPTSSIEQVTAKQIALMIDASEPGTEISLDVEEVVNKAEKNNIEWPITIDNVNNLVRVKLSEKSYYDYTFFNDVDVSDYSIDFNKKLLRLEIK